MNTAIKCCQRAIFLILALGLTHHGVEAASNASSLQKAVFQTSFEQGEGAAPADTAPCKQMAVWKEGMARTGQKSLGIEIPAGTGSARGQYSWSVKTPTLQIGKEYVLSVYVMVGTGSGRDGGVFINNPAVFARTDYNEGSSVSFPLLPDGKWHKYNFALERYVLASYEDRPFTLGVQLNAKNASDIKVYFDDVEIREVEDLGDFSGGPVRAAEHPARNRTPMRLDGISSAAEIFPVSAGLPFAMGEAASAEQVRLMGKKGEVLSQKEVLSRWPDGSVRWMLLDFPASPAEEEYVLEFGREIKAGELKKGISIEEEANSFRIDAGRLQVSIRKDRFAIFEAVYLDGKKMIEKPGGAYCEIAEEPSASKMALTPTGASREGVGERHHSLGNPETAYSSLNGPPKEIKVETKGPLHAVLRAEGVHRNPEGKTLMNYIIRLHFFYNQPFVKISYTVVQTQPEDFIDLGGVYLRLPLPEATGQVAYSFFEDDGGKLSQAESGGPVYLFQRVTGVDGETPLIPPETGLSKFSWALPGEENLIIALDNRERAKGWADFVKGTAGIACAIRHFWQNAPREIAATPADLRLFLYPAAAEPFPFHTGAAKTMDALFLFHQGELSSQARAQLETFLRTPLFSASPERYRQTQVFGFNSLYPAGPDRDNYRTAANNFLEALLKRREEGGWYGFWNFGDFRLQGMNWANMNCGVDHGLFIQYLSTSDRRFFDLADAAALHFRDIDVRHTPWRTDRQPKPDHRILDMGYFIEPADIGCSWFSLKRGLTDRSCVPKRAAGKYYLGEPGYIHSSSLAHIKQEKDMWAGASILGLLDHFLLTGDRRSLEVAESVVGAILRTERVDPPHFDAETIWPAIDLLAFYSVTGDERCLRRVGSTLNYLQRHRYRMQGAIYPLTILCRQMRPHANAEKIDKFLLKMLEIFRAGREMTNEDGANELLLSAETETPEKAFALTELLAEAYRISSDERYLKQATAVFKTALSKYPESPHLLWEVGLPIPNQ